MRLAMVAVALALVGGCEQPEAAPSGLSPYDPLRRPANGKLFADREGRFVVALPADRPSRELSVYDFETGHVLRVRDPEPSARYDYGDVAISRDGRRLLALRRFLEPQRRPEVVIVELPSRTIRTLPIAARRIDGVLPDAQENHAYVLRSPADERPTSTGVGRNAETATDALAAASVARLDRIDLATGEQENGGFVIRDPSAAVVTARHIYFAHRGLLRAGSAAGPSSTSEAEGGPAVGSAYARLATDGPQALPTRRAQPASFGDLGVATLIRVGPRRLDRVRDRFALLDLAGLRLAEAWELPQSGLQISDDEASLSVLTDRATCWFVRAAPDAGLCAPHDLARPDLRWLDAAMSHDGQRLVIGRETAQRGSRRWCRLRPMQPVADCVWKSDQEFVVEVVTLKSN